MTRSIDPNAFIARAKEAEAQQDWELADRLYAKAREGSGDARLIHQHAIVVLRGGNHARAATMLRHALKRDPTFDDAAYQLAEIYLAQSRIEEAKDIFSGVLERNPDSVGALRRLAKIEQELDETEAAEKKLRRVIELAPDDIEGGLLLGAVLANDGKRFDEAEPVFQHVLEIAPNVPSAHHNFGLLKRFQGELDIAEHHLLEACRLKPTESDFFFSLGTCYLFQEQIEKAYEAFEQAVTINPKNNAAQVYKAFALFHLGRMQDGWAQYEKRLELDVLKDASYHRPRWKGEDVRGKPLLLISEQGMGDNIQFIRYVPALIERGATVIVATHASLIDLFKTVDDATYVMQAIPEPKYFYRYCSLMSLPYILDTNENNIPANVPYLRAPVPKREQWQSRLEEYSGYKVGLSWRGNPRHTNDRFRSSSLEQFLPLLQVETATFFCLSNKLPDAEQDLTDQVINIGAEFETFSDVAGVMENLDLVITVDTAICHLAGALGRPVWTMLAKGPDFRWGLDGATSPWYPTMKLYRQSNLGDWSDVIAQMAVDLGGLITSRAH